MKTNSAFYRMLAASAICLLSFFGQAQSPVNDDAKGAITMGVASGCWSITGSTFKCTQSLPPNICAGELPFAANDLWYKFVTAGNYFIEVIAKPASGILALALYAETADEAGYISCTSSLGDGVADLQAGLLPAGTYYYRVYAANSTGVQFQTCVKGVIPPGSPQQFSELVSEAEKFSNDYGLVAGTLRVYPNPSNGLFSVGFYSESSGPYYLAIQDQYGNRIKAIKNFSVAGLNQIEIDLTDFGQGIYTIVATGSVINSSAKAIIQ